MKLPIQIELTMKKDYPLNWKIFWFTLLTTFFFVSIHLVQLPKRELVSPLPAKSDSFDTILPKLQYKVNTFRLFRQTSFVPKSYAGSLFDNASSYILIDFDTGDIFAEKNASKKLPIASLTKVMTAIVALDLADPNEVFTAQENISSIIPTHIAMEPGEKMTLTELLHASLLTSANDATHLIQEGIDQKYNEAVFIRAMNKKASLIGLRNTNFTNPQGFDNKNHLSTVEDFALLSHYALTNYPLIAEIVKKDYFELFENSNHDHHNLYNWNGLLGVYPGVFGVKIGNTDKAGNTTAVGAERNGKKLLAVLLGAPGVLERDLWTAQLLDFGFRTLANLPQVDVTELQLREKYGSWKYGE